MPQGDGGSVAGEDVPPNGSMERSRTIRCSHGKTRPSHHLNRPKRYRPRNQSWQPSPCRSGRSNASSMRPRTALRFTRVNALGMTPRDVSAVPSLAARRDKMASVLAAAPRPSVPTSSRMWRPAKRRRATRPTSGHFAASLRLPTSCNSYAFATQEVISLCPARSPASFFLKKNRGCWQSNGSDAGSRRSPP